MAATPTEAIDDILRGFKETVEWQEREEIAKLIETLVANDETAGNLVAELEAEVLRLKAEAGVPASCPVCWERAWLHTEVSAEGCRIICRGGPPPIFVRHDLYKGPLARGPMGAYQAHAAAGGEDKDKETDDGSNTD